MEKKNIRKMTPIQIMGFALEIMRLQHPRPSLKDCVKEIREAEKEASAR